MRDFTRFPNFRGEAGIGATREESKIHGGDKYMYYNILIPINYGFQNEKQRENGKIRREEKPVRHPAKK